MCDELVTHAPTDHATKQPIKQPNQSMCDRLATHALIVDQTNLLQHWLCLGTRTPVPEQTQIFTDKDKSHDCVQNVVYQQMCAYLKKTKACRCTRTDTSLCVSAYKATSNQTTNQSTDQPCLAHNQITSNAWCTGWLGGCVVLWSMVTQTCTHSQPVQPINITAAHLSSQPSNQPANRSTHQPTNPNTQTN